MKKQLECNGRFLTSNAHLANTFLKRLMGLMGAKALKADYCLILTPCSSIHMGFMQMPLDIAYLDKKGTVLDVQLGLKPWKIGRIVSGTAAVLEAPVGGIVGTLKIGDQLTWQ